jgi:aminoglycoside phosphotransferase family enzyme/predicted kinase
MSGLPPPIAALLDPGTYPTRPSSIELVQTHISYVFLAGADVYKVKKAVRFAFLDFSTLERRRHFCHEEVRLNARLAGDTYLGVVAIRPTAAGFALAPEDAGDAVEYAVHMRRLPAERMLPALLARREATPGLIEAIADKLAAFHAAADAGPEVARGGDPGVIAELLERDFSEVDAFHGTTISADDDAAIRRFCREFLARHDGLLRRRQAEGRIRDGHGDLHADHICCVDGLVVFDCIEFNPAFRHHDVAAEIAFLSMDLEYRGRPDFAAHLVARYAERTADGDLAGLIPFYACQRAYIRGKVDSLKSTEPEVEEAERKLARASAAAHFALAYQYTWSYRPLLIVIVGLSGSGKSSVAAALQARTAFVHLNSDSTRKRLAGLPTTARPGAWLYTAERNAATYQALYDDTASALRRGRGVLLDATFQRRIDRDAARAIARRCGVPIAFVECACPEDEIRRRLLQRAHRNEDASDADWEIYRRQREVYEPFAPDESVGHIVADTTRPRAELLRDIEAALRSLS